MSNAAGETETSSPFRSAMKWMGIIGAILSFAAGVQQFISQTAETEERERQLVELMTVGEAQMTAKDFPRAWASYESAAELAEQGNFLAKLTRRIGKQRQQVRSAQEDLAMRWLENATVPSGNGFASVVDPLLPILHRGVPTATSVRLGDLYAHIGWGYFLKFRDGDRMLDPEPWYLKALAADPQNPYAHVYLGHWQLWNRKPLEPALREFEAALASKREDAFVRNLQRSALVNVRSNEAQVEIVRMVDDMRKKGEPGDAIALREVRSVYANALRDGELMQGLLKALPAQEHLATAKLAQMGAPNDTWVRAMEAMLQEAAGARSDALATWRAVRATFPGRTDHVLARRADVAIKALAK
jgi:tetratricopeptide (TPR) repeat protein